MRGQVPPARIDAGWVASADRAAPPVRIRSPATSSQAIAHAIGEARAAARAGRRHHQHAGRRYASLAATPACRRSCLPRAAWLQRADGRRTLAAARRADRCVTAGRAGAARRPGSARAVLGVAGAAARDRRTRCTDAAISIHLGESPEEVEFLRDGGGPVARVARKRWVCGIRHWTPPGVRSGRVPRRLGLLTERLLAVHGVQLTDASWRSWPRAGATVVTCPRSNRWTGAGMPPIDALLRVRRARRDRHRQPRECRGSEPVRRVGGDAARWRPDVPAARSCESATRTAPTRSVSATTRHDRARQARRADRRPRAGGVSRCGRIPGERHQAGDVGWFAMSLADPRVSSPEPRVPN